MNTMAETITLPQPREKQDRKLKRQPPYHVILLNDDDHTVDYVVLMMQTLFGHPVERGVQIAREVDESGRCIVYTCTRELAELKQEQIHDFGPDKRIDCCKGGMSADIEPAE
jgi:ATP-dependent Clp protease adaptor protein ClpS